MKLLFRDSLNRQFYGKFKRKFYICDSYTLTPETDNLIHSPTKKTHCLCYTPLNSTQTH